jgi:hypothetical protein
MVLRSSNNAKEIPVNVVGSSTFGIFPKISSEKTYNMFISDEWLIGFPGYHRIYELFGNIGEGRGIFRSIRGNFILVVINSAVYTFSNDFTATFIGNLNTNSGEVSIDENLNSQICIVDGTKSYIYNYRGAPFITVQTLDPNLIPNYVVFHNTFFLFGNGATTATGSAWFVYGYETPTTISLVSQLALQTKPDYAIAVTRIPGQGGNILVLGTSVCEIHTAQDGLIPYRRNNTISIDYGCLSISTIDESDEYVAWLGINEKNSPVLMIYTGQGANRISTDGIDFQLSKIQFPTESTASFLRICGHLIYQLTFYNSVDNVTLIYDFNTQKFFHLSNQKNNYHPARSYAYFNNTIYFVSLNNTSLYELNLDIKNINENISPANDSNNIYPIRRMRICENLKNHNSSRFVANRFVFTLEQGNDSNVTGISLNNIFPMITEPLFHPLNPVVPPEAFMLTELGQLMVTEDSWNGQSSYSQPYQPKVDLSISYDGGETWSLPVSRGLNPIAVRKNIISWNNLGLCNFITMKLEFWGIDRFVSNNGILEVR